MCSAPTTFSQSSWGTGLAASEYARRYFSGVAYALRVRRSDGRAGCPPSEGRRRGSCWARRERGVHWAGKLLFWNRISREEYRSTAFPINNPRNAAQQRTYSDTPVYGWHVRAGGGDGCLFQSSRGGRRWAAAGRGSCGSLSADAKPSSADAQRLKAIDEGTWAVLKQLSMAGAPLCEWPGAVPGHDTVAVAGWMEDGRNPLAALCPACLGKSKALLEAAIDEDGPRICAFAGCV